MFTFRFPTADNAIFVDYALKFISVGGKTKQETLYVIIKRERKRESAWIFHFDRKTDGEIIKEEEVKGDGEVMVARENLRRVRNAPKIEIGIFLSSVVHT